ncbi:alpha/beta fold hydrolase [Antrihabitans sp. NCIMB 15449]|uniref:Alpha/beta fold hydrolase n=1 Tax=Antrihabitans spumae TaxID=3373370 RepID=A0ABW7JVM5_9NOCA
MDTRTARSKDGTSIAYTVTGEGPVLVLVDAAGHFRRLSSFDGLSTQLADRFRVVQYDRRGRGASTDFSGTDRTPDAVVQREVDDLAAVAAANGGSAYVHGFSSGALLALHASVRGLAIARMTVLEPPIDSSAQRGPSDTQRAFTHELTRLVDSGDREATLGFYLTAIGVPDDVVDRMRSTDSWSLMRSVSHTLVYDSLISEATSLKMLASVTTPTLVLDSAGSTDDLTGMAATVARHIPGSSHLSLPGEWHGVADEHLAAALTTFFIHS